VEEKEIFRKEHRASCMQNARKQEAKGIPFFQVPRATWRGFQDQVELILLGATVRLNRFDLNGNQQKQTLEYF
jgi:hypothetical protein